MIQIIDKFLEMLKKNYNNSLRFFYWFDWVYVFLIFNYFDIAIYLFAKA